MEKKRPAVIRFADGANNNSVGKASVGGMGGDGIVFEGDSHNNQVSDFTVGVSGLSTAIESAKYELSKVQMDEIIKSEIIARVTSIEDAKDKETRFERYKSLLDLIDKHIAVLGPVYGVLRKLWDFF